MKKKKYVHLNQFQRDRIQAMLDNGHKQKDIANVIGVHKSTISREIQRNRRKIRKKGGTINGRYEAKVAQNKAYNKRKYARFQGKKIWDNNDLREYIIKKLRKKWNPDVISGVMRLEKKPFYASKTAIYEFLDSHYGQRYAKHLKSKRRSKKKRKQKKTKRTLIPNKISIHNRPKIIDKNKEYGHYEGDTIVSGKKHHSKKALSVMRERKSKYVLIEKISCLKPAENNKAIKKMSDKVNDVKSITFDNGIENTKHEELKEKLNIGTFFCDPFSSYQKPHVENVNKQIRESIPKGSDINNYSDKYIENICSRLNNTPRKSLKYKTPKQVMIENNLLKVEKLIILKFNAIKNAQKVALRG